VGFEPKEDVYVTNVVKRRPPNNRDPTQEELDFYLPFLFEEIRLVDPCIVLLTGRHSMRAVLNETNTISRVRGQWYFRDDRWYMPMFHPSYLLRNNFWTPGSPKFLTYEDMKSVREKFLQVCAPEKS